MKKLSVLVCLLAVLVPTLARAQVVHPVVGPAPSSGGGTGANSTSQTFGGSPSSTYTFSVVGGTTYATNNKTGVVDFSGSDMRVVWDAVVAAIPTGGHFFWKNGTYECNSLDQESTGGLSNFYCIGIPGGGPSQYAQWILEGETAPPPIDQFDSTPAQTSGVTFHLSTTAVSSVAANSKIMIVWARPDTVNGVGPQVFLKNLGVRVPTNQRGCESLVDTTQALSTDYENIAGDTDVAESSLAFPVQASCVAWGKTDSGGLMGLSTTGSIKQANWMRRASTIGMDVGLDIQSEHTLLEHSYAVRGNHGIDYGVRGGTISHSSVWIASGCGEVARCLTFGANMALGSALTILSFDLEDACPSGGSCSTAFVPVYHALETNPGNTNGLISYSDTLQTIGVQGLPNLFDGGGGASFSILQATSQHNIARTPALDSFLRTSAATLGPGWSNIPYPSITSTSLQIAFNTARPIGAGLSSGAAVFIGGTFNNDQFSKVTVAAMNSNTNSVAEVFTNANLPTVSHYIYFCFGIAAGGGSGIAKRVAGVTTTLVSQTSAIGCNAGDTIELRHIGSSLFAYRNGVLDNNFAPNPIIDATVTGGFPGVFVQQSAAGAVALQNFSGGSPPTIHGTDSLFSTDAYATTYNTATNCAAAGSNVAASAVACGSAASGMFSIPVTTPTSAVVTTTALTANSEITVNQRLDTTAGAGSALAVTCNTTPNTTAPNVTSRTATTFTITFAAFTTNPGCYQYNIRN